MGEQKSPRDLRVPYGDIFADIVESIMAAQADCVELMASGLKLSDIDHGRLNRHFTWLVPYVKQGENRHLFEAAQKELKPLRYSSTKHPRQSIPSEVLEKLKQRRPLDSPTQEDESNLVRANPTRISMLVSNSITATVGSIDSNSKGSYFEIVSPLFVAWEYMTHPDLSGNGAYVQLTLRNFLFDYFRVYAQPTNNIKDDGALPHSFSAQDIRAAYSAIQTSFRERYWSKGEDKITVGQNQSGVVKAYLAARGYLWLRFTDRQDCIDYLRSGFSATQANRFEYSRSRRISELPDVEEVANEMLGIPLPLGGADTIFSGGLRMSSRGGLVMALTGDAGTGKTTLALAMSRYLAPFGIPTLFFSAEETEQEILDKSDSLVPDDLSRLSVSSELDAADHSLFVQTVSIDITKKSEALNRIREALRSLANTLRDDTESDAASLGAPRICRAIVVFDGLQDLIRDIGHEKTSDPTDVSASEQLWQFIEECKKLRALVILTSSRDWGGESKLDFLVDVAMTLSMDSVTEFGRRPQRRLHLTKARHQLCAVGTHGLRISGSKGVRLDPQINYELARRAIYRSREPATDLIINSFARTASGDSSVRSKSLRFFKNPHAVEVYRGSNIFIGGIGSGQKAGLALKLAIAPTFRPGGKKVDRHERVLLVSFLYSAEHYQSIFSHLVKLADQEYDRNAYPSAPVLDVIHLFPGGYGPDQLYNKIERVIRSAELWATPFTAVVIDGLHNVFLQFPEIERYKTFWPQLYSYLLTRDLTIITTHTTFLRPLSEGASGLILDEQESSSLKHALVQKMDFRFEVVPREPKSPYENRTKVLADAFEVHTHGAINQGLPREPTLWSRQGMFFFLDDIQPELPLTSPKKKFRS